MDYHAKHYFLTYARTDLSPQDFVDHAIPNLPTEIPVESYTVGREHHGDGYPHLHVLLTFDRKVHVRDETFFDTTDYTGEIRHPNIRVAPRAYSTWLKNTIAYCQKDGDFLSTHRPDASSKWQIIHEAGISNIDDNAFMQCVFTTDPRSAYLYGDNILRNRQHVQPVIPVPTLYQRDTFTEPQVLTDWVSNNLTV